ncbi:Ig-like domain-containing protein [Emticicia agri]|uniref:Ig-like domain-containing protein n=1 Tax=Emticicia agri TaxID=2492393 RepID=A0A4Q5LZL5_9BACT|nr:3-coathanger stack domain-containing protein [Emticicia agri]RYU95436.1 hypothetical protein EWM59_12275 [Emticicia agri]
MKHIFTFKKYIVPVLSILLSDLTFAQPTQLLTETQTPEGVTNNSLSVAEMSIIPKYNPESSIAGHTPEKTPDTGLVNTGVHTATLKKQVIDAPMYVFASSENVCSGDSIYLWATCNTGNLVWYLSTTATNPLGTGAPFTLFPISNATYYAACETEFEASTRVATNQVVVSAKPSMPGNVLVNKTTTCRGTDVIVSATCTDGTLKWFNNEFDADSVGSGTNLSVTPMETKRYYAACKSGNCISNRIATNEITVLDVPDAPTQVLIDRSEICSGTNVSLTSNCSSGSSSWYNTSVGGAILDGGIQTPLENTTYYGACINNGCESPRNDSVSVVVIRQPTVPTDLRVSKISICKGESVILSGTCDIGIIRWYSYPKGISTFQGSGNNLSVTPDTTTNYYAACENGNCVSERTYTEDVVVNEHPATPTNVAVNYTEVCSGSAVLLSANFNAGTLKWYTTASGGTAIGTGTNLSHNPTAATIYYAACENGGCTSTRVATSQLNIRPKPAKPVIAGKTTICSGEHISLTADIPNPGADCYWSSGLTGLSVDVSPTSNRSYRVSITDNNCQSDSSDAFSIIVNPRPVPPAITTNNPAICKGGSTVITGQSANTSDNFYWSTPQSGSGRINAAIGSDRSTRVVTEPGIYKGWSESVFGCVSAENSITILQAANCNGQNFITIMPIKPTICPNTTVTLTASGCNGTITWSDGHSTYVGTFIKVSPSVTTPYVAQCSSGGSSGTDVVVANTNVVVANNVSTGVEHVKAILTLQSSRKIGEPDFTPAPNVTFEAGKSILLKPGFVAERHTTFTAEIKTCY